MYDAIGYRVILMSILENSGLGEVIHELKQKTTLLSGHSGVGKSAFINAIIPGLKLTTQDVSGWSGKGLHTTTFAEMYDLTFGGKIIDTPGMREFGLVDLPPNELSHYFREMRPILTSCKFNNCLHINEPDCAIKQAVMKGMIHANRYVSYVNILGTIEEKKY